MRGKALSVLLVMLLPGLPALGAEGTDGVEEVEACMRANMPTATSVQTVKLRTVDRLGGKRTLEAKIYWKRSDEGLSRTLVEVEAPPADRGSSYLWLEYPDRDDMFVFLPEIARVRRIHPRTASGSMFGTDFSYEDVQHLQKLSGEARTAERLADDALDGRPVFRVRVTPAADGGSAYRRIDYAVDRETCVPLEIRFYGEGEEPAKLLRSDPASVTREGKGWIARSVTLRDLGNETESHLQVEEIELDAQLRDRVFSVQRLEQRSH